MRCYNQMFNDIDETLIPSENIICLKSLTKLVLKLYICRLKLLMNGWIIYHLHILLPNPSEIGVINSLPVQNILSCSQNYFSSKYITPSSPKRACVTRQLIKIHIFFCK